MICNPVVMAQGGGQVELETVLGEIRPTSACKIWYVDKEGKQVVREYAATSATRYAVCPAKGTLVLVDSGTNMITVDVSGSVTTISTLGGAFGMGYSLFLADGEFTVSAY